MKLEYSEQEKDCHEEYLTNSLLASMFSRRYKRGNEVTEYLRNIPDKIKTSITKIPDIMPLKDRDTNTVLKIFNRNVAKDFYHLLAKRSLTSLSVIGLVIILHIDEYQEIFTFENNKGLFKEMMLTLGPLMTESNRLQTTEYSFTFVHCPLLLTKSILEIFDFFAKKEDKEGYWMCNTSVLQLLYNTSELPRALETIINECFKKETFFLDVKNNNFTLFDDVFQVVINSLANQAIPVDLDTVISKKLKVLTVKDLMRDGWLNIVPDTTHKMLQPDSKMVWDTLEKFVANYKIFRNNLFAKLKKYKKGISLKEFYHGAVSKDLVLEIKMGLKKLDLLMDLNGFVILNGHSAPFADIFLLRKTIPESRNLLIAFQQKWYTTSQEFTIDDAVIECNKNKNAYKDVEDYDLRKFLKESCIVTVIFTSRPFKGNPNDLPDDCLIIAKRNFSQYFGLLFALQLSFDIVNHLNINSLEPKQIAERIDGIGDKVDQTLVGEVISEAIYKNRPYKNASELIEKNKTYKITLEKARTQLEDCSFAPHSFFLD
ncbi:17321_t:CDS:2, partial [Rhizophagus irregularis]